MGLAASQARFLSLTSRMSDSELEVQQICRERIELANQMNQYADEYADATSNQVVVANVWENNGLNQANVTLNWDVINRDPLNGGLGMKLVTSSGLIVVPDIDEMNKMIEDSKKVASEAKTPDGTPTTITSVKELTPGDFLIMEEIRDTDTLRKNLEDGNMFFSADKDKDSGEWIKKNISQINGVTTEYDATDDAAAKAIYDKRMRKAESTDTMLEVRMDQLETDHQAMEKEMESLEKLIQNEIESDFKTFG